MNIIETIDNYGVSQPEKPAHIYKDSILTYKELKMKSDALASYIIETYKNDKTPIAVYGHKQNEMLICFLACVKSGHSYIPIDSSLPMERVNDIVKNSITKLIFDVSNDYINNSVNVINFIEINNIILKYYGIEPGSSYFAKGEDPYYIIYTSGSTGKPKGVQITRSCLESFINWGLKISGVSAGGGNVFMNQAPFSFDLSVMDLYLSLASGSALFSIDKEMIANLKSLFNAFCVSNISHWVSTPSFAEMCTADSSFNKELLPKLDTMLFCGETLPTSLVKKLNDRFPGIKVINTYGPTEATVAVTSIEIDKELYNGTLPLPVGYVKDDCIIKILDSEGKEVIEGEKGEIVIIGDSVSIGYFNNIEMTEKVFVKFKVNGIEKRAYKTGDEGYILNGLLYYLGRIDFQVKLNGFRIELEDIESNFRKIDCIKNSVVLPVYNGSKIQYLTAVVVLNKKFEEKDYKVAVMIKENLKKYIPDYMIPRKIVFRDSIPMTINGKIDRKALMVEVL